VISAAANGKIATVQFKIFRGTMISWAELFTEAARFATELGPARVRSISHSGCRGRGIVVVWYADEQAGAAPALALELRVELVRGRLISWEELFAQTASAVASIRPEQLVSISHSDDDGDGVVARWYWVARAPDPAPPPPPPAE